MHVVHQLTGSRNLSPVPLTIKVSHIVRIKLNKVLFVNRATNEGAINKKNINMATTHE